MVSNQAVGFGKSFEVTGLFESQSFRLLGEQPRAALDRETGGFAVDFLVEGIVRIAVPTNEVLEYRAVIGGLETAHVAKEFRPL